MAESNGNDLFLEGLDPEIRARLSQGNVVSRLTNFKFGGSIHPESSLQIYIKKRAPRDYMGFVDATSMAPSSSLRNRGVKLYNGLVNTPVSGDSQLLQESMEKQLEYLNHARHGPIAKQLLLTDTLPHHDYNLNVAVISDCLSADCHAVRRDAATRLERLIIVTNNTYFHAYKSQLLVLAQKTYDVIHDDTSDAIMGDKEHLRVCGHLHLLAMSALLCRKTHRPTLAECSPFMNWQKPNKKQQTGNASAVRQEVLKMIHVFYDSFERRMKDPKSKMAAISDVKKFIKADFSDQLSFLFLLLNQIAEEEWSEKALQLLRDLKEVIDAIIREGRRLKPEVKSGLGTLLTRSLVVLLNFTFAKVREEVGGESSYNHPVQAAQLLTSIHSIIQHQQTKDLLLLPHLSTVAYHENPQVRDILTELLNNLNQPRLYTALGYLEASLGVADFHIEHPEEVESVCSWYKLKGDFGRRVGIDCHMLVHAPQCKGNRSPYCECGDGLPGEEDEDWRRMKHNMQMLVKLSACNQGADTLAKKGAAHKVHNGLVQVLAFQNSPFLFYATESIQGRRLLEHLINHRAAHRWLSDSVLSRVMHDVISGLEFLANQNIASREIASYYLLVGGQTRRGGVASQRTDLLTMEDCTVKLTSLSLSHQFRAEGDRRNSVRPVESQGPIPLLWTAPEALLLGQYSELSMVYSAGCVMYELWTHGCQPFTTYQTPTAETVRLMLLKPDSMPLIRWPCIPEEVYGLMRRCTASEPHLRPSLASLKMTFMEMQTRRSSKDEVEVFNLQGKEQDYPGFSDDQVKRKHLPELGIPPDVQQIIANYKKDRNDSYNNTNQNLWKDHSDNSPASASRELNSPYWIQYAYLEDFTCVREKLPSGFARKELPLLEKRTTTEQDHLRGVTDWVQDEKNQSRLEEESRDHIVHERLYRPAWTLLDAACKGMLITSASGYYAMIMERYVHVLLSLARALHGLHKSGWLHRDIRASNILVDCQTGEVTLARLGRMCQFRLPSGCVKEQAFEDSWRWLGPEVLCGGEFTKENDVFMFGTVVWETFWCREVTERNPTATETSFVPFADKSRKEILQLVRQKTALKKPEQCPDWLYELSVTCRNPDPAMRPPTSDIIRTLEKGIVQIQDPSKRFLPHPKLLVAAHERASEAATLPPLPERFHTKHARPFRHSSPEDPAAQRNPRPITLKSIHLDTLDEDAPLSSAATGGCIIPAHPSQVGEGSGYLTPVSEEVKAVLESRFEEGSTPRRQSSEKLRSEKVGLSSREKGRSVSESELSSAHRVGLSLKEGAEQRVKVFRKPAGRSLPPLPTEDEAQARKGDKDVYEEID